MKYIFLVLISLIGLNIKAQSPQNLQSWLIYFGTTQVKQSKFSIHHEVQLRDHQLFGDHNQSLIRVGGQYRFRPYFQATVGYGFIHSESKDTPNTPFDEHRIYQEALFSHDLSIVKVRHRLRLEERFIADQDFRGRFRYSFFADIPLTAKGMIKQGWYLSLYDEVFINLSDDKQLKAFDRNRAYGGLGYKLNDHLGVQLGYMRQHVGTAEGTNHLLLSFHHKMTWK